MRSFNVIVLVFFLSLLLIFGSCTENANFCVNCISPHLSRKLDDFLDMALVPYLSLFASAFEHRCDKPGTIICVGECVAVKIEEKLKNGQRTGYFLGCASNFVRPADRMKEPATADKQICHKPIHHAFGYHYTADVSLCRCLGHECNSQRKAEYSAADIQTNIQNNIDSQNRDAPGILPPHAANGINAYSSSKAVYLFIIFMLAAKKAF